MPIWSAATITRFSLEGEQEIATSLKCIIARTSPSIVALTSTYILPADLLSIRRVTWNGIKIEPMPARDYHSLNNVASSSRPIFYIFNQQGRNTIRFYPIPDVTIASGTQLFSSDIESCVIVEYYQIPDGSTVLLPAYIRRRLIKYWVLYKCFMQEGKGQNLKASKRFKVRYDFYFAHFKHIYAGHWVAQLNTLDSPYGIDVLAPPKLSYKYGEGAEF